MLKRCCGHQSKSRGRTKGNSNRGVCRTRNINHSNGHVELAKGEYPHLKDLWFSDICKGLDELEMDVLVSTDYLWNFQKERTIRGDPDQAS